MNLDLGSVKENGLLKKHLFHLKVDRSDGYKYPVSSWSDNLFILLEILTYRLILQVHHSYNDSTGNGKQYRFIFSSFNDFGTHLAVSDHKGNVFIIDLEMEKYWLIPNVGIPTIVSFPVLKRHELLIGLDTTSILLVQIETGSILGILKGHSAPPTEVSYSNDGNYYLTSCKVEAIIWDLKNFCQIQTLSLKPEASIKKAVFLPVTNYIVVCFQDDTMNVWKFDTFECIKQLIPDPSKSCSLKALAVTKNGRALVVGGLTPNLVIFCLDTWAIKRVVEFPGYISGVKQIEFVPQPFDGGANKILTLLTTSLEIFFFDIESSIFLKSLDQIGRTSVKISLSSNGKYLANILTTGEVNVYLVEKVLSNKIFLSDLDESQKAHLSFNHDYRMCSNISERTQKSFESLNSVQKQLKHILDVKKLLPMLKQFGEYPDAYRVIIWKTILQTPENHHSFASLAFKKYHPSYIKLETKYPLVNKSLCNSLKKLLSNLSYWCPLFGEVDFLPEFVFPFVKLFHCEPLATFEVVATIIVNWCQNWFEFYPFPPINMLSIMENILGYHDPDLLEFYMKKNITTNVSVCSLFHTAFSEVLSKNEWLKLWDHILSNEPSFLFMVIIAYNVICKNAVKTFQNPTELEEFFHKQNLIDMKMLISKAYRYLRDTPDEIHPRQFFSQFQPLSCGGTYTSFSNYPKLIIDPRIDKLNSIRQEEESILEEQFKALTIKSKLDKKLKSENNVSKQEKIYNELEEKIRKTVDEEENRILTQRQRLRNLRQELRIQELEVLEETRRKALKERLKRKKIEFERLLEDISKRRAREKLEVDVIEEEVRKYFSKLLLRKYELECGLSFKDSSDTTETLSALQKKLNNDLLDFQNEWTSLQQSKSIDFTNKLATIKALVHDLETEIAKEFFLKNVDDQSKENKKYVEQIKKKVNILEDEVEQLLTKSLDELQTQQKKQEAINPRLKNIELSFSETESDFSDFHKKITNSQDQLTNKKVSSSETHKTVKTITKKFSPGIKTITMIRKRVPKGKTKNLSKTKLQECCSKGKSYGVKNSDLKAFSKCTNPYQKSKFTCPSVQRRSRLDISNKVCKTSEDCTKYSNSKLSVNNKSQQSSGDFVKQNKVCQNIESKKYSLPKLPKNNDASEETDNDNEIFKSALRARWELIDEAALRQNVELIFDKSVNTT